MLCIAAPSGLEKELARIRGVFGLPAAAPPPLVTLESLQRYGDYLAEHLVFPFEALFAETTPPVRRLVRYVTVLRVCSVVRPASAGLSCDVEGLPRTRQVALAEIGVREDNPNYLLIDDYAYWFYNWRP